MAQRWMQAKDMLARKHGRTTSKVGIMGDVREDRLVGYVAPKILPDPKPNNARYVRRNTDNHVKQERLRKAYYASLTAAPTTPLIAASRVKIS